MTERCPICGGREIEPCSEVFDRILNRRQRRWTVRRCRACGYGWTHPPLPESEIPSHYPPAYLGDTARTVEDYLSGRLVRSRSWRNETDKVRLVARCLPGGGRLLDVGCGDGKFLWALPPSLWQRFGVERDAAVAALVNARLEALEIIPGDIYSPRLEEASFDALTFWHVLEHLPRPAEVLSRSAGLLRPGGWLFVSLPNLDSLQARLFGEFWYGFADVPRHLHHFSPRALRLLLDGAGLQWAGRRFFSRRVSFHCLKHSLLPWAVERAGGRGVYYALKPLLGPFSLLEGLTGRGGVLTVLARKPR